MKVDCEKFSLAREDALLGEKKLLGIGTLGEGPVHKTLKYYIEPDSAKHEVSYLGLVADVMNENGIFEIQTRSLERLVPKLERFLEVEKTTVVHPLFSKKYLIWLDKSTGELSTPRLSPKHSAPADSLVEIYKLFRFLGNPSFSIVLVFLTGEEYRLLDGYDKTQHKGATKLDRVPREIVSTMTLSTPADVSALMPDLPHPFTAREFYKSIGRRGRSAYYALRALVDIGIVTECGKRGNAKLFDY